MKARLKETTARILTGALAAAAVLSLAGGAFADFPERTIIYIVPYAAGGGSDRTSRAVVPFIEKHLGGSIAVVNKPGASGNVGMGELARARPDGYTIGLFNFPDGITGPIVSKDVPYHISDFEFVGSINNDPMVLVVRKDSAIKSLGDFQVAAKSKTVTVGIPSMRNVTSIAATQLAAALGGNINKIPFDGGGPTMNALLGGHVDSIVVGLTAINKLRGEVRALGQTSDERSATGADIPTMQELGVDVVSLVFRNVAAPKGVPAEVMAKLRAAFKAALEDPEFLAQAKKQGVAVAYRSGDQMGQIAARFDKEMQHLWKTMPWMTIE